VLARPREAEKLRAEVVDMRQRMRQELDKSTGDRTDLKQGRGGIVDVEFMVQFMVLRWSCEYTGLLRYTDNLRLLEEIAAAGLLSDGETRHLAEAYLALRQRINRLALQDEPPLVGNDELVDYRETVAAVWDRVMGGKSKVRSER
jgi:glutamate-ammonia-ligase adenylyltransferase